MPHNAGQIVRGLATRVDIRAFELRVTLMTGIMFAAFFLAVIAMVKLL